MGILRINVLNNYRVDEHRWKYVLKANRELSNSATAHERPRTTNKTRINYRETLEISFDLIIVSNYPEYWLLLFSVSPKRRHEVSWVFFRSNFPVARLSFAVLFLTCLSLRYISFIIKTFMTFISIRMCERPRRGLARVLKSSSTLNRQ